MLNTIPKIPDLPEDQLPREYRGIKRLPIEPYISPAYYASVREAVFGQSWLYIGLTREVPEGNRGIVKYVPPLNKRVVIIRSAQDQFQAFQSDPKDKDAVLTPVEFQTWREFMFVNFADKPKESLAESLGEIGRRYQSYPFEKTRHRTRFSINLQCNWMVAIDSFQEAYHAGYLHGVWSNGNPKGKLLDYFLYGKNRSSTFNRPGRRPATMMEAEAQKYGGSGLYINTQTQKIPGININGHSNSLSEFNVIFPNVFLNLSSRSFWTHQFWPISHNQTLYEVTYYDPSPQNYAADVALCYNRSRTLITLREDFSQLDRQQRGLESGAIKEVILGEAEALLKHFHSVVAQTVDEFNKE